MTVFAPGHVGSDASDLLLSSSSLLMGFLLPLLLALSASCLL